MSQIFGNLSPNFFVGLALQRTRLQSLTCKVLMAGSAILLRAQISLVFWITGSKLFNSLLCLYAVTRTTDVILPVKTRQF